MDEGVCFSPSALALLGSVWVVIQGVIIFLFRGWLGSLKDQNTQCRADIDSLRAERDRALGGWEQTLGLGERAVRRERRRA